MRLVASVSSFLSSPLGLNTQGVGDGLFGFQLTREDCSRWRSLHLFFAHMGTVSFVLGVTILYIIIHVCLG